MDFVKNQFQRIQQQLAGLTASQKMLTAALVAIMVMTLLYWGRYAGTADMVPLFDQALSASEQGAIQQRLASKGIKPANAGGQLLVPADRKIEVLADLAYAKALPRNFESGFEQMLVKLSPWASATERDAVYNRAKEITTAQLISYFPEVEGAQVVLDPRQKRQLGASGDIEPSASITISTREGANRREVAEAAAAVVVGSLAGLKPERISVVINGRPQRPRGASGTIGPDADEQFERQALSEQKEEKRISELFDIDGLRVKVSVKLNNEFLESEQEKFDPNGVIVRPQQERTSETETFGTPPANPEPGALPNVGADIAAANGPMDVNGGGGGAAGGLTHRDATEEITNRVAIGSTRTKIRKGPGEATVVSASIRVPRSYFINGVRLTAGEARSTDDKVVQGYIEQQRKVMEDEVRSVAGMDAAAKVVVTDYPDVLPPPSAVAGVPATATMSIPTQIGRYGKEIALGGLALVSLFMVSMMVKKSAPAPVLATPIPIGPPPQLVAGEALAGEAGTGDPLLDGMELDDDAVKTQQMLDQVSTLVKDNPDGAAALVKRWLNRD